MFSHGRYTLGTVLLLVCVLLGSCRRAQHDHSTVVVLIENSPTSLDPRIGTDAVSEHLHELIFDGLVSVGPNFEFQPSLAVSWESLNSTTVVFHLRHGVRFHNGAEFTSRDVAWTLNSVRDGTVITAKTNAFASIDYVETPDVLTVVLHLKRADNNLFENLTSSALGIVPYGSKKDFSKHPIGTGPFQFVSQAMDQDVVIAANQLYWKKVPTIKKVRFTVVPDSNTRTLELQKGSADLYVNPTTMDTLPVLAKFPQLKIEELPGTVIQYLSFNMRDPILKDVRVRRAIAAAINRPLIIETLLRGHARPAESLLPIGHWAYWQSSPEDTDHLSFDPVAAERLLDQVGYPRKADGIRFHTTLKTSTDESARLLAAILQQQLARVGIALDLKSNEFATFYNDVTHGAFSIYSLRWVGGNEQPSIFAFAFSTERQAPKGGNRGYYSNKQVDALLHAAEQTQDLQKRREDFFEVQKILLKEMPSVNLWLQNAIVVHNRRISNIVPSTSGSLLFLADAHLASN